MTNSKSNIEEPRLDRLEKQVKRIEETCTDFSKAIENHNAALDKLERTVADTKKDLIDRHERIARLEKQFLEFQSLVNTDRASVVTLENTVGAYADAYKANHDNIQILRDRVKEVEIKTGLRSPYDAEE